MNRHPSSTPPRKCSGLLGSLALAVMAFSFQPTVGAAQGAASTANVVRRIDHILISSSQAKELFSLFSNTFDLPVAWPMSDYGGFSSGGIAVGNVNVEVIQTSPPNTGAARFVGLALEPEPLRTTLSALDARLVRHGAPAPFRSRGWFFPSPIRWTTVGLPSVSNDAVEVFLCEYPEDPAARRNRLGEQLRSRNGGPLSVQSVREIVYGTSDLRRSQEQWQSLLEPLQPSSAVAWQLGNGPALRLVQTKQDGIEGMTITVKSLGQARRFLEESDLLRTDQPAALTVGGALKALNITLVEHRSEDP